MATTTNGHETQALRSRRSRGPMVLDTTTAIPRAVNRPFRPDHMASAGALPLPEPC